MAYVDNDTILDIVGFGSNQVYFGKGNGDGTFKRGQPAVADFCKNAGGWNSTEYQRLVIDADNDDKVDIVAFGANQVYFGKGNGNGTFQKGKVIHTDFTKRTGWTSSQHQRLLADVNNDNKIDIVGFGDNGVFVGLGTSDSSYRLVEYLCTISMLCQHSDESDKSVEIYGNLKINGQNFFSRGTSNTITLDTDVAKTLVKSKRIYARRGSAINFTGWLKDDDDSPNPDDDLGSTSKTINLGGFTHTFKEKDGDTKVEVFVHVRKNEIQDYEKGSSFNGFESLINRFEGKDTAPEEFRVNGTSSNHMFTHYSAGVEHCQGVTKAGDNWVISHDTRKGRSEGLLVICKPNGDCVFHLFGNSNHPGAIQACGDVVIVPMSNENKTYFIDVSNPDHPITLDVKLPKGTGAAGLVYHEAEGVHYALAGSGSNSADFLYKSNGKSLSSPDCRFTLVTNRNIRARQGMSNLVYDPSNNSIYMVAMEKNVDNNARETIIVDKIYDGSQDTLINICKIGFSSYPGDSLNYSESSRWGAGLVDIGNNRFELVAVARLLSGGPGANYVEMQRWKIP